MPRRPRKTAGKPRPVNRADSKIKKWDKLSDIPLDAEDEFHASRDKVLLEGNNFGEDEDGDEDEVFGLDLDEDDDEVEQENAEDDEEIPVATKKSSKSRKPKAKSTSESSSDEESEEEGWGRGRSAYYSSNAAQLESDDEEGNELEEQEARRLQTKSRDSMRDEDFGLEDVVEPIALDAVEDTTTPVDLAPQDVQSLVRHLEKTSPETLALARDWEETAESLSKTRQKIATSEADSVGLGMIHIHYREFSSLSAELLVKISLEALLSYATALAFYLHLRSSEKYARQPELLRTHPVMARLLTLKQSLITLEDLDFAASESELYSDDASDFDGDEFMDAKQLWKLGRMEGLEENELAGLLDDAAAVQENQERDSARPRKKRKTSKMSTAHPVFDLVEPVFTTSTGTQHRSDSNEDAYGEATFLQHADAADKKARRKSLRFHTSKIESSSARRQGARNSAMGGDDDLPYREHGKQATKISQIRNEGGEDLVESEPQRRVSDVEDTNGYYELVKRKAKEKKEQKKAEYEAAQEAVRPDFESSISDGPRSLTRAILKNKGLTPRRPKSVRNPRVKKREKFRKANMKVSSQKAVYRGGLAETGRYDGEKSGISKVIKSVRLE
ncbi:Sas10 C-terminal domain-containing protein [Mycena pura]|uniref:Sas10 C-terminal domain-containing protein n=1 Tax=Mycena pura TaxID=153505 RepID=A0AAD6VHK3_9AGAR|nr:Sas10 C-terminal domain-containing protein [Mycena pura]